MQYVNDNTTDYLVRFCNAQNFNEVFNGSLITRGVQERGMNILFPLNNTGFDYLQQYMKNTAEKTGEEYLDNLDKARFLDLKKKVKNDYVLKKL